MRKWKVIEGSADVIEERLNELEKGLARSADFRIQSHKVLAHPEGVVHVVIVSYRQ